MAGREKGKLVDPKREKGKFGDPKGKRENCGNHFCDPHPLGNQTARTHARSHARMARHETSSRWTHHPTSDSENLRHHQQRM